MTFWKMLVIAGLGRVEVAVRLPPAARFNRMNAYPMRPENTGSQIRLLGHRANEGFESFAMKRLK